MAENIRAAWRSDIAAEIAPLSVMGTVTSTSPLQVLIDGDATSRVCSRLSSYTPTVNDRVQCDRVSGSSRYVIQGKVV